MAEAERFARMAIAIDPADAEGHVVLGDKLIWYGGFAESAAELDRALRLNPSSSDVMVKSAMAMPYLGRPDEGAALCDRAYRLNPLSSPLYPLHCFESYFFAKRYRDLLDMIQRANSWTPPSAFRMSYQAAAEAELGAIDDAAATVAEWKQEFPGVSVEAIGFGAFFARRQEADQFLASLRKAGAPICVPADKIAALPKPMHIAYCDAERAKEAAR